MEHFGGEFILLPQNYLQLLNEFDLDAVLVPNEGQDSRVASLSGELGLVRVEWIPFRRELVAVLRIEELWVPIIKIVDGVRLRDVREVEEVEEICRLLRDRVKVETSLDSDWVLRTRIVQELLLRYGLWLLINLVETKGAHDKHWNDELEDGTEPGSPPIDAILSGQRLHVTPISAH